MADDLQKPEVSLVKRLRDFDPHNMHEWEAVDLAANRIEELKREVMRWHGLFDEKHNLLMATKDKAEAAILDLMAERYRAKALLDKAVVALEVCVSTLEAANTDAGVKTATVREAIATARATLAEIEGGKKDD
jgi:hypothetical protein